MKSVKIVRLKDYPAENPSFYFKIHTQSFGDYSDYIAAMSPDKKSMTIQIRDGGFGDLDGAVNGVIVGSYGIGQNTGGSGSGGCFLKVIDY